LYGEGRTISGFRKFWPPKNVLAYFQSPLGSLEAVRPCLGAVMGYAKLHAARMARLDDALRRMIASCPAPGRLRALAEELAALHASDALIAAWRAKQI
jgi:hypothetical protein